MQKISNNVYVETGFRGCNCGFVITKEGIVVVDTPQIPTDAIKWREEIAKYGPVRYIVNTEPHGDHFTGNHFLSGTVIAHEGTRQVIMAASLDQLKERLQQMDPDSLPLLEGFSYRLPTITISNRLTIHLGEHTFQLINFPGHTAYQVAVCIPEERLVFTSDNIVYKTQAFLHEALPFEWLDSLRRMQDLPVDTVIPGHGDICNPSYIPEMMDFIQDWIDKVTEAIDSGMSQEEAQNRISLLDRYPMENGSESRGLEIQRMNVARLYQLLKK